MKIALDATPIGLNTPDRGGVYRYVWQLIEALARLDETNEYRLFFDFFRREHRSVMAATMRQLQLGRNFRAVRAKLPPTISSRFGVPAEVQVGPVDVFHATFDLLPKTLAAARVVTVHDVRYLEPNLEDGTAEAAANPAEQERWREDQENRLRLFDRLRRTIGGTIAGADKVITVSEFSKQQIIRALGTPDGKIEVIHHGLEPKFAPPPPGQIEAMRARHGLHRPYLLCVSKFDPLKNLERLLAAFARLGDLEISLVLSGPENWFTQVIRQRIADTGLAERVILPGFVDEAELPALYAGAEAFVLPTLYEGFGLPAIEAMACGTPVLTSNSTAMPEITGGAALLVAPQSVEDIAAGMRTILSDTSLRSRLREQGFARSRMFTWAKCAEQTLAVYQAARASRRSRLATV